MKRTLALFVLSGLALAACSPEPLPNKTPQNGNNKTPEKTVPLSKDPTLTFYVSPVSGDPAPWSNGETISIYEMRGDTLKRYSQGLTVDDGTAAVSMKFKQLSDGVTTSYALVYPKRTSENFTVPASQKPLADAADPTTDFIYAISRTYTGQPVDKTSITLDAHRFGAVLDIAIKGLPLGIKADQIVFTFPTEVTGTFSFNPADGTAALVSWSGKTITATPDTLHSETSSYKLRTCPTTLPKGGIISITAQSYSHTFIGEAVLGEDLVLENGGTATISAEVVNKATFTNPVTTGSWADPTVWYDNGTFYSYSTMGSSVKKMKTSKDLVNWSNASSAPFTTETNDVLVSYGSSRWAPDVTKIGDKWMMYMTCRNDKSSGIVAMSSTSAAGPFTVIRRITYSGTTGISDSIDPEVVKDPATGRVWLFFGSTGRIHRVELNESGTDLISGAKYVHVAGLASNEIAGRERIFEGAYLHYHDGWWYFFASAGSYWNSSYKVVVGRSATLDGEFLARDGRKMVEGYATDVIASGGYDRLFGPGHNAEIFTDLTGRQYILYHSHDSKAGDNEKRFMCAQQIFWDEEGWPYVKNGMPAESDAVPVF